jgi:hypothetical protein
MYKLLNYEYVEGTADKIVYATADLNALQPVDMLGKASNQYYIINTNEVSYNQTVSNVNKETTAGQLLAQGSGANLIQQGVDIKYRTYLHCNKNR